jgi:hypothetical protein
VQFGRYIGQVFQNFGARQIASFGREASLRGGIGQELQNCRTFGQDTAVIHLQCGDIALGIDRQIIGTAGGLALGRIYRLDLECLTDFVQNNVAGKRAGAGFVKEFHRALAFLGCR